MLMLSKPACETDVCFFAYLLMFFGVYSAFIVLALEYAMESDVEEIAEHDVRGRRF